MTHVLVLGGGFAGLEATVRLRKRGYDVTLVSDRDYLFIYPISIWIPTGAATFESVCFSLKKLESVHGFKLVVAPVKGISASAQRVFLEGHEPLAYDYLVVAIGADKVQHPGQEHFVSICGPPEESQRLQQQLNDLVARGSGSIAVGFGGNPKDPTGVRGGPAFEVLFNIDYFLRKHKVRDKFQLTFFAPMPKPGIRLGEKALGMIDVMLGRYDIEKRVGKKIVGFEPDGVLLEGGEKIDSDLTTFIPACTGKRLLSESDLPLTEAGFIEIDDHCQVVGFENVYAVGDVARIEGPQWRAKQGHLAHVMARCAAANIDAHRRNIEQRKSYRDHMVIMCVMDTGNGAAFVHRNDRRGLIIPMPVVGHWLKKAWAWYFKRSNLRR